MRCGTFLDHLTVRDPNASIVVRIGGRDCPIKRVTTLKDGTVVITVVQKGENP